MYALVRFKHETDFHEVPLGCITQKISGENALERFNPKNFDDFDNSRYYYIKWICEDYECEKVKIKPIHKHYYRAKVLLLAENLKELQKKRLLGRVKIGKQLNDATSTSPESDDDSENDQPTDPNETTLIAKHPRDNLLAVITQDKETPPCQSSSENKRRQIQSFLHKRKSLVDSGEPTEKRSKTLVSKQHAKTLAKIGYSQQTQVVQKINNNHHSNSKSIPQDYDGQELHEDLTLVNVDNRNEDEHDQSQVEHNNHNETEHDEEEEEEDDDSFPIISKEKVQSIKLKYLLPERSNIKLNIKGKKRNAFYDGEIYLGLQIFIDEEVWHLLKLQKNPWIFMRDVADILWTPIKLVNRTFSVSQCSTKINPNSPRKKLEKDKLKLLKTILTEYCVEKRMTEKEIAKVKESFNKKLTQKIADLKKTFRRVKEMLPNNSVWLLDEETVEEYYSQIRKRLEELNNM
uniref:BEN domain-containing protein n=1 Tax=Trichogramma kaykai TaxID=54128 RepID=A0ABD2WQJ8_9HYME